MKSIIVIFFNWIRRASFYRTKVVLFSILVSGIMFDIFIEVDFKKMTFNYGNNTSSTTVLLGLILTCIIFVGFDFWLERTKSIERRKKEIAILIGDSKVSKSIKKELVKSLLD